LDLDCFTLSLHDALPISQTVRDYLGGMGLLLRRREVWTLAIMSGFRSITHSGLLAFLPLYLADVLKVNPFMMGLALTLLQVGGADRKSPRLNSSHVKISY